MQELKLADKFMDWVKTGRKTNTVRMGVRKMDFGPMLFKSVSGEIEPILVDVYRIEIVNVSEITVTHAICDGFGSIAELILALVEFYPDMKPTDAVTVISWELK